MNTDFPKTPRDELEAQVTALLLGELSEEQAAPLRSAIAQDAELRRLHDQLKLAIGLLRETVARPVAPEWVSSSPPKFSPERRNKLLAQLTIPPLKQSDVKPKRGIPVSLIGVLAVIAIVGILAAMLLPATSKSKSRAQSVSVQSNLRQLEVAKQIWADENQKSAGAAPTFEDLQPYMGRGGNPIPPSVMGETYVLGKVGEPVAAEVDAREAKRFFRLPAGQSGVPARGERIRVSSDGQLAFAETTSLNTRDSLNASGGSQEILRRPVPALVPPPAPAEPPATNLYSMRIVGYGITPLEQPPGSPPPAVGAPADRAARGPSSEVSEREPRTPSSAKAHVQIVLPTIANDAIEGSPMVAGELTLERYGLERESADHFAFGGTAVGQAGTDRLATAATTDSDKSRRDVALGASALVRNGRLLLEAGRHNEAEASFKPALEAAPENRAAENYSSVAKEAELRAAGRPAPKSNIRLAGLPDAERSALRQNGPTEEQVRVSTGDIAGAGSGGAGARGGLRFLTRTNQSEEISQRLRQIYTQQGIDLSTPGKAVFFNERTGELLVRGTKEDLDAIERINEQLASAGRSKKPADSTLAASTNSVARAQAEPDGRENLIAEARQADLAKAEQSRPYFEKKRELEETIRLRDVLAAKVEWEQVYQELPKTGLPLIVDMAVPAQAKSGWFGGFFGGSYQSIARVKVERDASDIAGLSSKQLRSSYDPYFVQTEFETIQSETVLSRAVEALKLDEVWATKDGAKLSKSEAVARLKEKMEVKPIRNTGLVEIRAKASQPDEAARLANAVAEAYRDHRLEQSLRRRASSLAALEQRLGEQDETVRRTRLELARVQEQINGREPDLPIRQPATNAPIPQPEIHTADNPFSTFSLNVSDVSFKLAAASLEQGRMPDAVSIRSEEFLNAFDYRDPEPAPGAPVAFAWERARYPFAHNRDLLRFSLKTAAAGRQAGRPLNIVLLLDNSGSMERADRVRIIREALQVLAAQMQAQDKLSVITFARTPRLVADGISGDKAGEVTDQVSGLTPQGGTNLEDAMNLGYQTAARHYLAGGINRVVLLTDGAANLGNVEPESLKQTVEAQRKQGIALDCFGIGWEGFNDDLLEVLSRNGDGRYGFLNSPEEAATEFAGQLAGALQVAASDVKVQVEFNPRRVTAYRQIGYAKHQLTKEQFRDNTVDAAEIAAQEAGNALYTVAVNPTGSGPLATVRVRYKIPGTTEYREQAWDVPYTGTALPLEHTSPAMRLAATASAFAEWLVVSPFAAEVTPDALLGYLGGVPEVYGADARPKQLEWMIRQAKSVAGK